MQTVVDSIHELFVGVQAPGSLPDLHLGEEMVTAWRQVRTVRRDVENLQVEESDWSICASRGVGSRVVVQENDAFSEHPAPLFWIEPQILFSVPLITWSHYHIITWSPYTRHNRRWISTALCPSAWRKRITARTLQLAEAAMIVSMFRQ